MLVTATLAGSFAVDHAIARRRGAWTLGLSSALALTILYVPVLVFAAVHPKSWFGKLVKLLLSELTRTLDFLGILLLFVLPVVTVIVAGAYAVGASRELDVRRQIRGQRGTIAAWR